MTKSFEEVKSAIELILTVDENAHVKVVDNKWCVCGDTIYVAIDDDEYTSYHIEDYTIVKIEGGMLQRLDDGGYCGGYTALIPYSLEITYEEFKEKYGQGSL